MTKNQTNEKNVSTSKSYLADFFSFSFSSSFFMSLAAWFWSRKTKTNNQQIKYLEAYSGLSRPYCNFLLTSTSAMKASSGSSSLSEPPPDCICCRVGEFSAGM